MIHYVHEIFMNLLEVFMNICSFTYDETKMAAIKCAICHDADFMNVHEHIHEHIMHIHEWCS